MMPWPDLSAFAEKVEPVREDDGTWTLHCNGVGNPGKLYNCEGDTPFEAIENGWEWLKMFEAELEREV